MLPNNLLSYRPQLWGLYFRVNPWLVKFLPRRRRKKGFPKSTAVFRKLIPESASGPCSFYQDHEYPLVCERKWTENRNYQDSPSLICDVLPIRILKPPAPCHSNHLYLLIYQSLWLGSINMKQITKKYENLHLCKSTVQNQPTFAEQQVLRKKMCEP